MANARKTPPTSQTKKRTRSPSTRKPIETPLQQSNRRSTPQHTQQHLANRQRQNHPQMDNAPFSFDTDCVTGFSRADPADARGPLLTEHRYTFQLPPTPLDLARSPVNSCGQESKLPKTGSSIQTVADCASQDKPSHPPQRSWQGSQERYKHCDRVCSRLNVRSFRSR